MFGRNPENQREHDSAINEDALHAAKSFISRERRANDPNIANLADRHVENARTKLRSFLS